MNRKGLFATLRDGDVLSSADLTAHRLPAVPSTLTNTKANFVVGPVSKLIITFDGEEVTVADTAQGVGTKILDWPAGTYRIKSVRASLQFTTTSVLADTLNPSKTIQWSLGSATLTSTGALTGKESDLLPAVSATSSATIDTANTATTGISTVAKLLNGATTAADTYLNITVPTAGDIDADATVELDGTITIEFEDLGTAAKATPANASRMPSTELWRNCPWDAIASGEVDGHVYFNDFTNGLVLAANQTATALGDGVVGETGATAGSVITTATDAPYGVVKLESTTDNEGAIISIGGATNTAGAYVLEAGKRLWMEARIKRSVITDSKINVFCGFAEEALCADGSLITTSDAMADKDYVGFQAVFADGDKLDTVYNTESGGSSPVTVGADAVTVAADTFVKVGIYCDGTTVYFFADGVQLADSIALTGTDFPDGQEMAFYLGLMLGHGDTNSVSIDWVKIAQQRA